MMEREIEAVREARRILELARSHLDSCNDAAREAETAFFKASEDLGAARKALMTAITGVPVFG